MKVASFFVRVVPASLSVAMTLGGCSSPPFEAPQNGPGASDSAPTQPAKTTVPETPTASPTAPAEEARRENVVEGRLSQARALLDSFACPTGSPTLVEGMNRGFLVGGRERAFHLALPKNAANKPMGVIFSWYGVGSSVDDWRSFFAPDPDALPDFPVAVVTPEDAALSVTTTPQGLTWDIFRSSPGDQNLEAALFEGVMGCLRQQRAIDVGHVHSVGFSGGAIVTGMLHARYAKLVHSVVQISGAWFNDKPTVDAVKANLAAAGPLAKRFGLDPEAFGLQWSAFGENETGAVLSTHGGAQDKYAVAGVKVLDFELSASFARPFLTQQQRQVLDCPHKGGHSIPSFLGPKDMVEFLWKNPLSEGMPELQSPRGLQGACAVVKP
jgi:predicted esterase